MDSLPTRIFRIVHRQSRRSQKPQEPVQCNQRMVTLCCDLLDIDMPMSTRRELVAELKM